MALRCFDRPFDRLRDHSATVVPSCVPLVASEQSSSATSSGTAVIYLYKWVLITRAEVRKGNIRVVDASFERFL